MRWPRHDFKAVPAMTGGMWAAVPVKDMAEAKTRLSPALAPKERRQLFRLMLEDVLAALVEVPKLAGVMVVTRDEEVASLGTTYGVRILLEAENCGQSAAVAHAAITLKSEGVTGLLTVPADVPLMTAELVEQLLFIQAPAPAVTIVPDTNGRGTNALLCSPPDLIDFHFGDDSFQPHLAEARRHGCKPAVIYMPDIGLDIDRPDDLAKLIAGPGATRAQAWLNDSGIARRLAAAAGRLEDQ